MFIRFILFVLLFVVCAFAQAQEAITIQKETDLLLVGKNISFWEDMGGKATIADAENADKAGEFQANKKDVFTRRGTKSVYWFKLTAQNFSKEDAWLEVGSVFMWYIDFYAQDSTGKFKKILETGSLRPNENKLQDVNLFWLPLNKAKDTSLKTYYVRLSTERAFEVPLQVGTLRSLHKYKTQNDFIVAGFLGLVLIMFLYNLFVYFSTRDRLYLIYITYLFFIFFTLPFTNNYPFFENVFIGFVDKNWWHTHTLAWQAGSFFMINYFGIVYLQLKKRLKYVYIFLIVLVFFLCGVLPLLILLGVPHIYLGLLQQYLLLTNSLTIVLASYYLWFRGYKQMSYYALAWTFLMFSLAIYLSVINGIVTFNIWFRNALYFGTATEIWFFSLALGNRYNILRHEKEKTAQDLLQKSLENEHLMHEQKQLLEEKVKERTQELENAYKEIQTVNEELQANEEEMRQNAESALEINENMTLTLRKLEKTQEILLARNRDVRDKEAQLMRVIDSVPSHLYELEFDVNAGKHVTLLSSHAAEKLYGIPDGEMRENSLRVMKVIHPEDLPTFVRTFEKVIKTKTIQEVTFRVKHENGTVKWLHGTMLPTASEDGEKLLLTGIVNDITEQKEAENLITYKGRLLSAIASATDKLLKIDDLTNALSSAFKIVGHAVEADRVYYYQNTQDQRGKYLTSQRITWLRIDDSIVKNASRYQNVPFEEIGGLFEQLTENHAFEAIISNLPANKFKEDLMNLQVKSVIILPLTVAGKFYGFIGFDDCNQERVWLSEEISILQSLVANVSTTIERGLAESALKTSEQELKANLKALQNTQDQLIESEKMAALGQLIAGVAHEINNPLGAIKASGNHIKNVLAHNLPVLPAFFSKMAPQVQEECVKLILQATLNEVTLSPKEDRALRREWRNLLEDKPLEDVDIFAENLVEMGLLPAQYDEYKHLLEDANAEEYAKILMRLTELLKSTKIINTAVERASKIVFALKKFSHTDRSEEKIQTNLQETIETVLTLYHNQIKRGIDLRTNFQTVPTFLGYPDELNQVWTNLTYNAMQAMDFKGKLEISIEQVGKEILVSFKDSGKGIPPEIKDKIFEAFFTTKPAGEGTGLGLSITKKIIDKHNARIELDSEVGVGTTFKIYFPLE